MAGKLFVERLFVPNKIFPVLFRQPRFVTVSSQSDIAFGESLGELFIPAVDYPLSNESAAFEIPLRVRNNLDGASLGSELTSGEKSSSASELKEDCA